MSLREVIAMYEKRTAGLILDNKRKVLQTNIRPAGDFSSGQAGTILADKFPVEFTGGTK
jgi:hypothetical protein